MAECAVSRPTLWREVLADASSFLASSKRITSLWRRLKESAHQLDAITAPAKAKPTLLVIFLFYLPASWGLSPLDIMRRRPSAGAAS